MVTLEIYRPGHVKNAAHDAIRDMMDGFDEGKSYADMMRHRISGAAAQACHDVYYVAHESGVARSRLWMGWGRHADAIGNWGNFYTDVAFRGQGLGKGLLDLWFADLQQTPTPPLCLLCTTGSAWVTALYGRYGFRPVIQGQDYGPLYKPVGNSPATFDALCDMYYQPSDVLSWRPADIAYRHEIDCLLRFVFAAHGLTFGFGEVSSVEAGLLYHPTRTGMLFSADGHCVGWTFDGQAQVYPMYADARII